jgi:hypothetical protein
LLIPNCDSDNTIATVAASTRCKAVDRSAAATATTAGERTAAAIAARAAGIACATSATMAQVSVN